jgi:phosphatidylserine/phosphatidylglycerophosphate/cardiolipin synthase-like enzyme
LRETVKEIINSAKNKLIVSGWSFGRDHEVIKLIRTTAERGVNVRVYARVSYGNTEALAALVSSGVTVRGHDRCHAKMVLADSNRALLMTSNFTERGLDTGFETGVELEGDEINALLTIANSWETVCEWNLQNSLQLRNATKQIRKKNPASKKIDLIEINDNTTKPLAPYYVQSLDLIQNRSFEKDNPNAITTNRQFKRVTYTWKFIPPTLPPRAFISSQAKERVPLYKLPSGETFVTVNNWEEIDIAKPIAAKWKAKIVLPLNKNSKK